MKRINAGLGQVPERSGVVALGFPLIGLAAIDTVFPVLALLLFEAFPSLFALLTSVAHALSVSRGATDAPHWLLKRKFDFCWSHGVCAFGRRLIRGRLRAAEPTAGSERQGELFGTTSTPPRVESRYAMSACSRAPLHSAGSSLKRPAREMRGAKSTRGAGVLDRQSAGAAGAQ
jgi:hypothetical protein